MRSETCCFTGHRKIPLEQLDIIAKRIELAVIDSIKKGYCTFCLGGALGFDTLAAKIVLKLKNKYPHIKIVLILPCFSQTRGWKDSDVVQYNQIKEKADSVLYISQEYTKGCMFKRNRYLVDNSSLCICYLAKETGGTAYTIKYAKRKGLKIINLMSDNY